MPSEKTDTNVEETQHGISPATHYPIVAEGTGKTLDAGAKAKEVHNVSICPSPSLSALLSNTIHHSTDQVAATQAELYAAIQESAIKKWSKESLHLYFAVFIAFCCACANGYDGSLMGAIIAMPHFQKTFGTTFAGEKVSIISSLYSV